MEPGETNRILPDDLLDGILVRLPVRDLLRFRCVSKSWRVLIDSSRFIGMHHHAQYAMRKAEGDVPYLLWSLPIINSFECYLLSKKQGDDIVKNLTADVVRDRRSAFRNCLGMRRDNTACRGSANGIICLEIEFTDLEWVRFYYCGLWNPATRDFKIVLHPDVPDQLGTGLESSRIIGFTFDSLSNDFKILATTTLNPTVSDKVFAYEVYSLSTNSWKRLSEPSLLGCTASVRLPTMDACFNGVHYWIASIVRNTELPMEAKRVFWILSFNFSTEVFKLSDPPQGVVLPPLDYDSREYVWEIGLYKECLALFFTHRFLDESVASVEIWAVKEFDDDFGAPLAWQCLFSTGPIPVLSWHTLVRAPRLDGDLLFIMKDMLLYLYNPTTGKFRDLGAIVYYCFNYVESLFPLSKMVVQN